MRDKVLIPTEQLPQGESYEDPSLRLALMRKAVAMALAAVRVTERNKFIFMARMGGATLADVGEDFGLSTERVRQIVLKVERLVKARLGLSERSSRGLPKQVVPASVAAPMRPQRATPDAIPAQPPKQVSPPRLVSWIDVNALPGRSFWSGCVRVGAPIWMMLEGRWLLGRYLGDCNEPAAFHALGSKNLARVECEGKIYAEDLSLLRPALRADETFSYLSERKAA